MSKIEQKSITEICNSNLNAESKKLEEVLCELDSVKKELNALVENNNFLVNEIENEKKKLISTIDDCFKHGGEVPNKLLEKKKELDLQVEKTRSHFLNSIEFHKMQDAINKLEDKTTSTKNASKIWKEKTELVNKIVGTVNAFYKDKGDENKIHLIRVNLQKKGLGLDTESVYVFKNLDEVVEFYFESSVINLFLSSEGVINEIKVSTVLGDLNFSVKNYESDVINLAPDELTWITEFNDSDILLKSDGDFGDINIQISEEVNGYRISILGIADDYLESKAHQKIFTGIKFYLEEDKEFYDINPRSVQVYKIENLELETEASKGKGFKYSNYYNESESHIVYDAAYLTKNYGTYYKTEAKYGLYEFANCDKPTVSVDVSSLFKDFGVLMKNNLSNPLTLKHKVDSAVSFLSSKKSFFIKNTTNLSNNEIISEIGIYWHAFINSPWDKHIPDSGPLRMLKHLCMRGHETPDICSLNYKGHYRYNVRTRDHTWIVGEIFCPPFALGRKTPIQSHEINYDVKTFGDQCVQVGDAVIRIIGEIK